MARYLIVSVIVLLVVGSIAGVLAIIRGQRQKSLPEYYIHIYIPFETPPVVDGDILQNNFKERWKIEVMAGETEKSGVRQDWIKTYFMGNGNHNLRLNVTQTPLEPGFVDLAISSAPELEDIERVALRNHKGYISIDYLIGPDEAVSRVKFATQALKTIAMLNGVLGYINASAMRYQSVSKIKYYSNLPELDSAELYLLFVNTHFVTDDNDIWLHTHGLEQFNLPDLEISFTDIKQKDYYYKLISEASVYMIEKGPVLKPGHTFELKGDGNIYGIKSGKRDKDHFGAFGSLEFVRK